MIDGLPASDGIIVNAKLLGAVIAGTLVNGGSFSLSIDSIPGAPIEMVLDGQDTGTLVDLSGTSPGEFVLANLSIITSIPLTEALFPIAGQYDRVFWFDRGSQVWLFHNIDSAWTSFNSLNSIKSGSFYWINTLSDVSFTVNGTQVDLFTGWNFIQWP